MDNYLETINAYRNKGLLVDTNLLLLFFVGLRSQRIIQQFKRTDKYSPEDFDCLKDVIDQFKQVVTTPSILTEVSNLLGQLAGGYRFSAFQAFSLGIQQFQEKFTPSRELIQESCFPKFGLTDAGIVQSANGKFLVLTDDFPLAGYLGSRGIDVINFNHLRVAYWGLN